MCTAFIYRNLDEKFIGIGFNRDESIIRRKSKPPIVFQENGVSVLCPLDSDFGGTWIGVNSQKEIYAVLNFYQTPMYFILNSISRGLLVKNLLSQKTSIDDLTEENLSRYFPFRILKVSLDKTDVFIWNTRILIRETYTESYQIFGSSYTEGMRSETTRKEIFETNYMDKLSAQNFGTIASEFLTCHKPNKGSLSPCMHRLDAHTVSQTIISIHDPNMQMKYKNEQPCKVSNYSEFSLM